ncbi:MULTISPECIES: lysozyme [unclassified Sinorhizobium]|uniref:lysozyme n=1 Tax=unclassified Sinorhizobium TaxID=2613772 RepID=UPI0024C2723A|nr:MULTISPECIES: lysozyme [unclassified Sinorhizobium]MDK1376435.1 lysozyme [Sinorhizobium sp. 6-70]MDK1479984.1 lysozyme [Sinorhizobium sp. 6-117]
MKTSLRGICAMLAEEAIVLAAYNDGTGTMTMGAGHTAAAGPPSPRSGMTISLTEAINIFRNDLSKTEDQVETAVRATLSQHQFDALVSWHFNTGAVSSATLTRKLNTGDVAGAATEFARWNKSKGKVLEGLVARRERETAMFLRGDYGDPKIRVLESKGGPEEIFTADQVEALIGGVVASEDEQSTEELLANPISQLLPLQRPKQGAAVTRVVLQKFHDLIPEDGRDDSVAVVAVRGYYLNTMGKEGANDRGVYDDAIIVVEPEGVHNFNGNTDPGRFGRGIAKLKSRQAIRYRPGPHGFSRKNGPYPAFRQDSNCTVIRDETGEDTDSPGRRFWINLHRGGITTTSSLGCQTVPPHQWNEFKTLVDGLLKKHSQETFYYLLVDQTDVPQEETTMAVIPQASPVPTEINRAQALQQILALGELLRQGSNTNEADMIFLRDAIRTVLPGEPKLVNPAVSEPKAMNDPLTSRSDPDLTPVNGALGKSIGRALDGRKTAIGVIGMLATTILPIFFPQLAPITAVAGPLIDGVTNAAATAGAATQTDGGIGRELVTAAFPIFATVGGWGVLGKVEKWVKAIQTALPTQPLVIKG